MKLAELKEMMVDAGETIEAPTHVSGACKKGNETIHTLPHIKYKLVVKMDGVALSTVVETIRYANLTVKSQQWLKSYTVQNGLDAAMKLLTPEDGELLRKRPDGMNIKYDHYVGGVLELTWAELFPTERAKATPESKILSAAAQMSKEELVAMLKKLTES